jgi:hypothetical protein
MSRRHKDPLRSLTTDERTMVQQVARSRSERADRVARAKALLAASDGATYTAAAAAAGRRAGDGVAHLVSRFNRVGRAARDGGHGGGPPRQYGAAERARILAEVQRAPNRQTDGTATWSLTTLQRALRHAPDGLPAGSTWTILDTRQAAGYRFQQDRTWCQTGVSRRKRTNGTVVTVTDPDATPNKTWSSAPTGWAKRWDCPSGAKTRPAPIRRFRIPALPGSRRDHRPGSPMRMSAAARPSC